MVSRSNAGWIRAVAAVGSAVTVCSAVSTAAEDIAEEESIDVGPAEGSLRLRTSSSIGDIDHRTIEESPQSPDELIKVVANDRVTAVYLGPKKIVGKRPDFMLRAVIEEEKKSNCKTKITRQPYEPEYHLEPTLTLGNQLKITLEMRSPAGDLIERRSFLANGTLEGGAMEVASSGFISVYYHYSEKDVAFKSRRLNADQIATMIRPKLDDIRRMPNYKIIGDGYRGEVRAGEYQSSQSAANCQSHTIAKSHSSSPSERNVRRPVVR